MLHDVTSCTIDTYLNVSLPSFFSERRCHLIGSLVQARCCRAIVSYCRSQWNLTLDRAGACCQEPNLIPSSCSHWRAIKKGLRPYGYTSSMWGQILVLYSCILRPAVWFVSQLDFTQDPFLNCQRGGYCGYCGGRLCTHCHLTWQPWPVPLPREMSLLSRSPLASQADVCLAHCRPADHKREFMLPRGAGNSRWIILGLGKPVF